MGIMLHPADQPENYIEMTYGSFGNLREAMAGFYGPEWQKHYIYEPKPEEQDRYMDEDDALIASLGIIPAAVRFLNQPDVGGELTAKEAQELYAEIKDKTLPATVPWRVRHNFDALKRILPDCARQNGLVWA